MKARRFRYVIVFGAAWMLGTAALAQDAKTTDKSKAQPPAKPEDKAVKPADKSAVKPGEKPAGQPSEEEMAKMMEAFQKASTPGEAHAKLKPLVGKWTFVTKARMSPEQPFEESTGKGEYRWILGDRILVHEVKANPGPNDAMMGRSFEGFGLTGYDNMTKKYFNVWTDNMGTGIMSSTGSADSSGKTFTYTGEYNCPMTGEHKNAKSVLTISGDDKLVFEMFDKGPDGKEFKNLEVTYTRQK